MLMTMVILKRGQKQKGKINHLLQKTSQVMPFFLVQRALQHFASIVRGKVLSGDNFQRWNDIYILGSIA